MRIIGQEQIASVMGVAPKTIVEWQEQGFPIAVRGAPGVPSQYDAPDCVRWLVKREVGKVQSESANDRLARVRADAIEMDNAERRKVLISATELEPKLRAAMVMAREQWMDAVPRVAREAIGKPYEQVEDLLQIEFSAFLERLAQWQSADLDEDEDAEP